MTPYIQQDDGLKKSVISEKKRRKRGKPLLFDFDTCKDGVAIFFSPNKTQHARDRQIAKDTQTEIKSQAERGGKSAAR